MCVVSRRFTLILVLAASLLLPSAASAQSAGSATGDWSSLNSIASGSKLVVKTKDGKTVEGRLGGVTDAALSLSVKNRPADLRREDVQSVYTVGKGSGTKSTLIGMGVGAGAGAAIGGAASSQSDGFDKIDHAVIAGLTVVGAGVGALTGHLLGRGAGKRVLVYEAGRP
jgi:hypothetical protein